MTDDNTSGNKEPKSSAGAIWTFAGLFVGMILFAKFYKYAGISDDEDYTLEQAFFILVLIFAPLYGFSAIGKQLVKEVEQEKITWATYWGTTVSILVAVFGLLGITSIDDLSAL